MEISEDKRIHDLQFDSNGLQRDSNGTSVKVGGDFNVFGSLTGELAVGYLERSYKDPSLPNIGGVIPDGSLIWQATRADDGKVHRRLRDQRIGPARRLRRLQPRLQSSGRPRVTAVAHRHADRRLRPRLCMSALPRDDNRYFASAGLTYKLNRDLQVKTTVRQDWLTSTVTGVAYNATSASPDRCGLQR